MAVNCWAYYPKQGKINERPEPLDVHLIEVAEEVSRHPDYGRIVKKISRLYGIDDALVKDAILLMGLLHDLGKAYVKYQERLDDESFSGHEFYSAFIIHGIFKNDIFMERYDKVKVMETLIIYPIMLHHYAQRNDVETAYEKVWKYVLMMREPTLKIWDGCRSHIVMVLKYGKSKVITDLGKELINKLLSNVGNLAFNIALLGDEPFKPLRSIVMQDYWLSIAALTGLLNEADGKVARRNRKG